MDVEVWRQAAAGGERCDIGARLAKPKGHSTARPGWRRRFCGESGRRLADVLRGGPGPAGLRHLPGRFEGALPGVRLPSTVAPSDGPPRRGWRGG